MFVEDDLPSVVVNAAVVNSAEWDEVVEVGGTTVLPKHDVVDFAAGEFDVTHRARCVHDSEGVFLGVGHRPTVPPYRQGTAHRHT